MKLLPSSRPRRGELINQVRIHVDGSVAMANQIVITFAIRLRVPGPLCLPPVWR
jgi:hypothetical protein